MSQIKHPALFTDLYELTMAACYFDHGMSEEATFSLFVRNYPPSRRYFVSAGLDDVLRYLAEVRFEPEELDYLEKTGLFQPAFLWEGSSMEIILVAFRVLVAILVLAGGLSGYLFGRMNYIWRALFLAIALASVSPNPQVYNVGSFLAIAVLLIRFLKAKLGVRSQQSTDTFT